MKIKNILLSGVVAMGCISASAQEADKTVNVFNPHWYVQAQIGGQYTLGEVGFGKLLSPNAQLGVGYNFNKVVGARFLLMHGRARQVRRLFLMALLQHTSGSGTISPLWLTQHSTSQTSSASTIQTVW